jgi:flagellar basal-body rod protein FlgB
MMSEVQLMNLAVQRADWLATRQSVLAQNVANVNTPRYHAKDIVPFESFLDNSQLTMSTTHNRHINISASAMELPRVEEDRSGEKVHSGNNVSLENEMLKLGETNSQFALDTGLIKSFNRMIMASLKS